MEKQVLIELEPDKAEELAKTLRKNHIEVEGPDEVDNLDGIAIASLVITVTPVVKDLVVAIIKALQGSSATIETPEKTVSLKSATVEEIQAILGGDGKGGKGGKKAASVKG
jgi:hypothetical protein